MMKFQYYPVLFVYEFPVFSSTFYGSKFVFIIIVSTRGASMVGTEGENFEIWNLQIALKWPSGAWTEAYSIFLKNNE